MTTDRWLAALHEAAHVVARLRLMNCRLAYAEVDDDGGGRATGGGLPMTFREAVCAACGGQGEKLIRRYPQPPVRERRRCTAAPVDGAVVLPVSAPIQGDLPPVPSDYAKIVSWCTRGGRADWREWRQRLLTTRWAARRFCRDHAEEIRAVAVRLYCDGVVLLRNEVTHGC